MAIAVKDALCSNSRRPLNVSHSIEDVIGRLAKNRRA
jgi:hypothetical protein